MFKNLKDVIKKLAKNAVLVAESELGSGKGQQKKQMAINYIVQHLPISEFAKYVISLLLSKFIDDAVEVAVDSMNSFEKEKGE